VVRIAIVFAGLEPAREASWRLAAPQLGFQEDGLLMEWWGDGACLCRRSSGGRVGAVAAAVQFPLQALNRGIEFAGSNGPRV